MSTIEPVPSSLPYGLLQYVEALVAHWRYLSVNGWLTLTQRSFQTNYMGQNAMTERLWTERAFLAMRRHL
jgi:hypothetical protein